MINDRALELIHGDIDGANSGDEQRELLALLEVSEEVRREHARMRELAGLLDALPACEPPLQLRQALRARIPVAAPPVPLRMQRMQPPRARVFAAFALAATVTGVAVLLLRGPEVQELDAAALAGTLGRPAAGPVAGDASVAIAELDFNGVVTLRRHERGLIVELDLEASRPVTVVAGADAPLALEGYISASGAPSSVTEEGGVIRLLHGGKHHYSLVLPWAGEPARALDLAFYIDGQLVKQIRLAVPPEGAPLPR